MAFFNELGKKISQTSQGVVQKTKDATETLRLNGMISDEEKKINTLFVEIGKKYFELHSESCESVFTPLVTEVKQSQEKIASFTEQVKKLKGVVRCPNCGGEVSYNSQFCNLCGAPMKITAIAADQSVAEQTVKDGKPCPSCGTIMPPDKVFCTNCGSKIVGDTEEKVILPTESAEMNTTLAEFLCPYCGKQLSPNALFCSGCGRKMRGE